MILGLLEVQLHDEQGNLLDTARGHNIIFDNARVNVLLNPCAIDQPAPFTMYANKEIRVRLSSGNHPTGSATIKFYCYYVIINL